MPRTRRGRTAVRARPPHRVLTFGVSLWWIVGLRTQGTYGLPVLQLTESVRTVASTSDPIDLFRGIGNWYFYGATGSGSRSTRRRRTPTTRG